MKFNLSLIIFTLFIQFGFSQALPIGIDGLFDDWTDASSTYSDSENDGGDYDLLSFSVSNDSSFLYIKLDISDEIELDDYNNLYLYIDSDNNSSTGYQINNIGAELSLVFGDRFAYFDDGSSYITVYQNDILLRSLPTVSSDTFEIAIGRGVYPDGVNPLFTSGTIKICFADDDSGGDYMPNLGTTFSYTFDETDVGSYNYIDLNKENSNHVRLMTYNVLYDGITDSDPDRVASFQRIITAVNPDIITFNECWNTRDYEIRQLLDDWIPLPNNASWYCKDNNSGNSGNVTCSKFNIISNYIVLTGARNFASLIDLPATYPRDILIINSHLKCCGGTTNDATRQEEVDAIIQFIKDVKHSGGIITLPYGTPYIISGDLNLVGSNRQLITLLTGDIVDNATFGDDESPDWDDTEISDIISFQTDQRMAYTHRNYYGSYWPGRLDFAISSDIGLTIQKTYVLNTEIMSSERLATFGLESSDTYIASDHLPKVTDFTINDEVEDITEIVNNPLKVYPNPSSSGYFYIAVENSDIESISVTDINGRVIKMITEINKSKYKLDLSQNKSGIYFIELTSGRTKYFLKVIK